jgi:protein-L-isoaspartate(D-aspartate) O-methyltransferase
MSDFAEQRVNMVESQVRPSDVTDRRIINAMLAVPREVFAPTAFAYADSSAPVSGAGAGSARYLLEPRIFAKLVQALGVEPHSVVLDVGCATGYSSAVLARLAKAVVALEEDASLSRRAEQALKDLRIENVVVVTAPLAGGSPSHAPFDAILLNGAVEDMPQALLDQLRDGGRLAAVAADATFGRAQVWRRIGKSFDTVAVFDAGAEPLPGFARKREFSF